MSLFKQEPTLGDWVRENNQFVRIGGVAETIQHVVSRLRLLRGEVARDTRVGVDYDNLVWDPKVDEGIIANHLATIIVETPGVVEAESQFELDERGNMTVVFVGVFSDQNLRDERVEHEAALIRQSDGQAEAL